MKKKVALATLAVLLAAGPLFGQNASPRPREWKGAGQRLPFFATPAPRFPLFGPFIGIFPSSPFSGRVGTLLLAERWLLGGAPWIWSGASRAFPRYSWFAGPYWGGGYGGESGGDRGSTGGFVEEWKNRDPFGAEEQQEIRSIVLSEGLREDEVVALVGYPQQRIQLGGREVWRYSGYSLLFEKGLLKEIR